MVVAIDGVADVEVDTLRPGEGVIDGVASEVPAGRDADPDGMGGAARMIPFTGFGAAVDDDIGAGASSMEPKVTEEPGERVSGGTGRRVGVHTLFRSCGACAIVGDADIGFDRDGANLEVKRHEREDQALRYETTQLVRCHEELYKPTLRSSTK